MAYHHRVFYQNNTTVLILQSSGLPNITGSLTGPYTASGAGTMGFRDCNGSFSPGTMGTSSGLPTSTALSNEMLSVNFDASKSSKVYGASTEVQTPNATVKLWKRIS